MGDGSTSGTVPTVTTAYVNKISASGDTWFLGGSIGMGTSSLGTNDRLTVKSAGNTLSYYGLKVQNSDGTDQLVVRSDGKVGIGLDPISELTVLGGAVVSTTWASTYPAPSGGLLVENNVGFGSITPSKALEINSASGENLRLVYNDPIGPTYTYGYTDFETDDTGNLYIKPTGTGVCIGTPIPKAKLEVTDSFLSTYSGSPIGYFGTDTSDKIALVGDSTPSGSIILPPGLNIGFFGVGDDYGGYFRATSPSGLKTGIYSEGTTYAGYFVGKGYFSDSVGIGNPSPAAKLVIHDNTDASMRFQDDDTGVTSGDGLYVGIDFNEIGFVWNYENTDLRFGTSNTARMIIEDDGDVGIGVLNPNDPLEVAGDTSADRFVARTGAADVEFADQDGTNGMKIENSDTYPNIWIGDYSVTSTNFRGIYMDGYLETTSIGTMDTRSRLVVASKDGEDDALRLLGPDGGATAWGARLNFGDEEYVYIEEDEDDKLYIHADDRIALMGSNVGIGEATPLTKLYVDGDVAFGDGSELTMTSGGAVTATHSYHTIDTYLDGSPDYLYIIWGGDVTGQILTIRAQHTDRTVVVKTGGNMQLQGDFTMDNKLDTLVLIYDSDLSTWLELSRSNNGA
jgi:hypothetical protein